MQDTFTEKEKKSVKSRTSIALDPEKKKAIEEIAKRQKRTAHYIMLEMINKGIEEAEAEAEYQEYIEKRVMHAYEEMMKNDTQGVGSSEAKEIVLQRLKATANK